MRHFDPTPEQERGWDEWVNHPDRGPVKEVASRFKPWNLYRIVETGHIVTVRSFDEEESGAVSMTVLVHADLNELVFFDYMVFGVSPSSLVEHEVNP